MIYAVSLKNCDPHTHLKCMLLLIVCWIMQSHNHIFLERLEISHRKNSAKHSTKMLSTCHKPLHYIIHKVDIQSFTYHLNLNPLKVHGTYILLVFRNVFVSFWSDISSLLYILQVTWESMLINKAMLCKSQCSQAMDRARLHKIVSHRKELSKRTKPKVSFFIHLFYPADFD